MTKVEPRDEEDHGGDDEDGGDEDELLISDGAKLLRAITAFVEEDGPEESKELRKEAREMGVTLARLVSEKAEFARTLVPSLEDDTDGKSQGPDPAEDAVDRAPGTPPAPESSKT